MSWTVRFSPLADEDVAEAYAEYEAARPGLGEEFLAEVGQVVDLIGAYPDGCPQVHQDLRRALVHRFPYSLYYHALSEAPIVEVRAVMHQHRHPRSWRRRA